MNRYAQGALDFVLSEDRLFWTVLLILMLAFSLMILHGRRLKDQELMEATSTRIERCSVREGRILITVNKEGEQEFECVYPFELLLEVPT